jgi:VWFA-related protein
MKFIHRFVPRLSILLSLAAVIAGAGDPASAQQPSSQTQDEVLRINAELVQTAVTVVDKKGKFVDGLNRDQFELVIDGNPRAISFLERVTAGSTREQQLATRNDGGVPGRAPASVSPSVHGRTIVFFLDDLHLSFDSLNRTRQMFERFLDTEMSSKDSVAIASSSGQIGFLQQFTNNKEILRAALARVKVQPSEARTLGMGNVPMSEFTALAIESNPDSRRNKVMAVYVEECLKQTGFMGGDRRTALTIRANCERLVKSNARTVLMNTGYATERMYDSLESLMRSSNRLAGRKLIFFISDGFMLQGGPLGGGSSNKLRQITDAAQRAGAVIYSIDARGLIGGTLDATNNVLSDANGRMAGMAATEIMATQDPLNALAEDTGGRALRNQNYFDRWVEKVLDETSNYYLVAWRPDTDAQKAAKFRNVKITITGRPDLIVRAPKGYVEGPQANESARVSGGEKPKATVVDLRETLSDYYPSNALETLLSLTHLNSPANGPVLTSSFQIAASSMDHGNDGRQPANVRLAGVVLNDKGKIAASFHTQLNIKPASRETSDMAGIIYNHHNPVAPGIYQVRVAARDERSGRIGSAMQWVVIPDLSTRKLTLSSLLIGGHVMDAQSKDATPKVQLSVDHRFSRSGHLGYWIFVYNARRDAAGATNLTAETEVLRDGHVILTAPKRKLGNDSTDPDRIPYGADLALKSLTPGKYDLRVRITDGVAGTTVSQITDFVVQ